MPDHTMKDGVKLRRLRDRLPRVLPGLLLALIAVLALSVGYFSSTLLPDLRQRMATLLPDDRDALPPVRLAIVGNFTGRGSEWDLPILNGARMLVEDTNARGGVAGRKLRLEVFDDHNDPDTATRIATTIAEREDILAVIGHGSSQTSLAAGDIYRQHRIPVIAPTATNPALTGGNEWYFRVIFSDELQGKVLAHYLRAVLGHESVAVVMNPTAYAQGLLRTFSDTAAEIALNVGPEFTLASDTPATVLREMARRIGLMNELNAVLLIMDPAEAARFLPILRAVGTRADLVGTDSLSQIDLADGADAADGGAPPYLDQVLLPLPFIPDTASRSARAFMADYRAEHGRFPSWPALFGYDATLVLGEALGRVLAGLALADTADIRRALRDELAAMATPDTGVVGLSGPLYFNPDGDVIRPIYVGRVDRRRLTPAAQQLLIVDNPDMVTVLREEGENVIEVDDAMLQLTQVVKTGLQVNAITDIDTVNKSFRAAFDLWFRYSGAFDPREIVFPDALEPLSLDTPLIERTWGNERYQSFRVTGRFGYQADIDHLRHSRQDFQIRFRHAQRDLSRLVYVPDLRAMGADSPRFSWAQVLRERGVIDDDSGWVIRDTAISQEIDNISTLGDPLMPLVEIPFSAFQVSIHAARAEVSLKRQIEGLLPPANTWFVVVALLVLLALTAYPGFARHHPLATTLLRLVILTLAVFYLEDALFDALRGRLETFQMEVLLNLFRVLWWLIPAIWAIRLLPTLVWQPIQRHTGNPVPSIARLAVNLAILIITSACITAFVFDKPLTSLWAASGVLTLVLGFALQSLIMDAFGGLMLSAERPFKIGDWIMVVGRNRANSPVGRVEEMNWRTTRLWTLDNNLLVIPNSAIAQATVENYSAPSRPSRIQVPVVLGFGVSVERAVAVLGEAARRAIGEGGLLAEPEPTVVVERVESDGIRYQVQGYHDMARVSAEVATTRTIAAMAAYLESLDMPLGLPGEVPSGPPQTPVVLAKQAPVQATGSPR